MTASKTNAFISAIDMRIASAKTSDASKAALKTLRASMEVPACVALFTSAESKTTFDFDIHALKQVKDIISLALGMMKPHGLKLDFEVNMQTMVNFEKANASFTANDMLISLDKSIKVEATKAKLYSRRPDHYGSAKRWHRAALNVLLELGVVKEVTRNEYRFAENDFSKAIIGAFAA